jgi:hypothetical protein
MPTDRYAVINGEKRHSNLHLGELHWGTDPTDEFDAPHQQTTLTFELDYHAQSDVAALDILNSSDGRLNRTYNLYGMNISYDVDEEIADPDHANVNGRSHADDIENQYHDQDDATAYFFVTRGYADGNPDIASSNGNDFAGIDFGAFLFTGEVNQTKPFYAQASAHEVGHLLGAGRPDDKAFDNALPHILEGEV